MVNDNISFILKNKSWTKNYVQITAEFISSCLEIGATRTQILK